MNQATFALHADERQTDIDIVHRGTAIYTALPEIEALLDRLDWPNTGKRLLDPGAGNGGFLVAALARLDLKTDDVRAASLRVHGYEFHAGAAKAARIAVETHLTGRGWSNCAASRAAELIVEIKDFLLDEVPNGLWDVIAANPPYWRYCHLPEGYRSDFDRAVAAHARQDMLFAYLQKVSDIMADDGTVGVICADRWLLNSGSAILRERIGERWTVADIRRLESTSAFYRPKARTKGTPARVHPVSMVLKRTGGQALGKAPFPIDIIPEVDGIPLSEVATVRLAPWLGPDGIFLLRDTSGFDASDLVPCFEPEDMTNGTLSVPSKWALRTGRHEPPQHVREHLEREMHRMPARGRQKIAWLPPEPFDGKLPLGSDAIMVPRISQTLRGVRLPAGTMPVNHNLVIISGVSPDRMLAILSDPRVRAQADALALRLEGGYRSYTATLLRALKVPRDLCA